ncbi:MAG: rRNA pseudouridine synthase [Chitinispirillaceae bacterium]|nr:rRNA pseudouridine synthase [Chitinispirillaceae bacterium]
MNLRIDRILSNFGYCTRKQARAWIKQGRVTVKGSVADDFAAKVDLHDVMVDDAPLDHPDGIYMAFHKPPGYVCSHDPSDGATIYELLPPSWELRDPKISSVGRLDMDASGLLLLTDDTVFMHRVTSPSRHVAKVYEVDVDHELDEALVEKFASGTVMLTGEQKPLLPAEMKITGTKSCEITLHEGRYHQIKRMFSANGFEVTRLHRIAYGKMLLGDLAIGKYREFDISDI